MPRVPVIIEIPGVSAPLKTLVASDKTVGELMVWLRVHVKMDPTKALFMFIGDGVLPSNSMTVGAMHDEHKSADDGRLYIKLKIENTFG